jgi:endonuclease-3
MTESKQPRKMGKTGPAPETRKRSFDIEKAIRLLREAMSPYPKAALFELFAEGYESLFEILVACIISIRTRDEMTLPVARALFACARTPPEMFELSVDEIDELISRCTFHEPKARTIRGISEAAIRDYGGELPCELDALLALHGVGPKCANLALGIVCNRSLIGVDVHVHRVTNRWGYVAEKTPEKTMAALIKKLPQAYWVEINALLVPFGKHVCTGSSPNCSTCPLLSMCRQVGVTRRR